MKDEDKTKVELIKELKNSEEYLKILFDYAPDAYYIHDLKGNFIDGNKQAEKLIGIKKEDLIGKNFIQSQLLSTKDMPKAKKSYVKTILGLPTGPDKYVLKRKDKSTVEVEISNYPVKIKGKTYVLGIARDIIERKRTEEEIQRKTEDLALINSLNNAVNRGNSILEILRLLARETKKIFSCQGETVYLLSEDKKYLDMQIFTRPPAMINRIEKLIGMKIPAIRISMKPGSLYWEILQKGQPWLINDPKTIQGLMAEFTENKILKKLIPKIYQILNVHSVINVPLVSKDKAFGLLEVSRKEPFSKSDLKRIKFVSEQLIPIIEHKKAIDNLWKSEEKFRITLKNSPIVVWNQDKDLRYTWVYNPNPGFSQEKTIGKTDKELLSTDDAEKLMQLKRKVLESGIGVREETKTTIQGNDSYYDLTVEPLRDSSNAIIGITCVAIDITSRRKTEQALIESEKKYRTVFENTGTATMILEDNMTVSMVNSQTEKLSGYTKEEIENKIKWTTFAHPEDLEKMKKYHIERRKAGGKAPTEYEFRLIDKKGNIRNIFMKIGIIPNTKKSIASLIDITKLKKTEEGLRESREKYFNLFNDANDLIHVINPAGKFLAVNRKWLTTLEYSQEEIKDIRVPDIVRKDKLKQFSERIQEIKKGKSTGFETIFISKSGKEINVEGRGNGLFKNGKLVSAVGIFRDITKRKQAEENVKSAKDELEIILDSVPAIIFYKDIEDRIIRTNKTNADAFGVPIKDMVGKTTEELFPQEQAEKMRKDDKEVIISGKPKRNIIESYTTHEGIKWQTIDKIPYRDKIGKIIGIIGLAKDITVQRKSEKKLQQSYQKLKKNMDATIDTMSNMIEAKDHYTSGHQQRVSQLAVAIATGLDLSQDKVEGIRIASLIHDIGKIGIPAEILSKSTILSDIEFSLIKAHSQIGYDILKSIDFAHPVAKIVLQHHEKINGTGYPNHLKGAEILLESKIICVSDVVEAMSSHRPYRPALGIDVALEEISQNKGILYDSEVVDVCLKIFKEKSFKF